MAVNFMMTVMFSEMGLRVLNVGAGWDWMYGIRRAMARNKVVRSEKGLGEMCDDIRPKSS